MSDERTDGVDSNNALVHWADIGVHPTPDAMALTFGSLVAHWVKDEQTEVRHLRILDACCGDGRLGHSVACQLVDLGFTVELVLLEVDALACADIPTSAKYSARVMRGDFLTTRFDFGFDVVVSNPPYLALSRHTADLLQLPWSEVIQSARNLYGVCLRRCIQAARPGGRVAVIAPHGWLNNGFAVSLREYVFERCAQIHVDAFARRTMFPGVSQDTSFQRLVVRHGLSDNCDTAVHWAVGSKCARAVRIRSENVLAGTQSQVRVRVGPFVWNRERHLISRTPGRGIAVVNGANIKKDGTFDFSDHRVRDHQYLERKATPASYISRGPLVVLKRTMRGAPGGWKVDAVMVCSPAAEYVGENHTILVEFRKNRSLRELERFRLLLVAGVARLHRMHGHPNLSVTLVRAAAQRALKTMTRIG